MTNSIFMRPKPKASCQYRIFCFPYAGGSAASYIPLEEHLDPEIEAVAIQPPGRGNRFYEPAFSDLNEYINAIEKEIYPLLDKPCIFYGHSLGARVAFELAHVLLQKDANTPALFVSAASRAPHLKTLAEPVSNLSDQEFITKLRRLGSGNASVLDNPELLELCMPMLRADFKIVDDYTYQVKPKLPGELLILSGSEDVAVSQEEAEGWSLHFDVSESQEVNGDHFFIDKDPQVVAELINQKIEHTMSALV